LQYEYWINNTRITLPEITTKMMNARIVEGKQKQSSQMNDQRKCQFGTIIMKGD
jgi:hypothetical protein